MQERNATPLAEYFKFRDKGQRVIGKVQKFFTNENGLSMVMSPVILWTKAKGTPQAYRNIAIGLTTDLRYKIIDPDDKDLWFSIELVGFEPSGKGAPRKMFKVLSLDENEVTAIAKESGADFSHKSDPFRNAVEGTGPIASDDDDLPF
jgi:hypothetical protein